VAAGLPLPPKSACFFCPSAHQDEINDLARREPKYFVLALEMERLYRAGRHFRGDNCFTVKGKRKKTGETEELTLTCKDEQEARAIFRQSFDDTAKPYKYEVRVNTAVVGLGRDHAWAHRLALPLLEETTCL
jgi:hypothetical protein